MGISGLLQTSFDIAYIIHVRKGSIAFWRLVKKNAFLKGRYEFIDCPYF